MHDLTNARGVDLNRNFPLPAPQQPVWFDFDGWRTGSDDPSNPFYRGEHPLSEPESAAIAGLLDRVASSERPSRTLATFALRISGSTDSPGSAGVANDPPHRHGVVKVAVPRLEHLDSA